MFRTLGILLSLFGYVCIATMTTLLLGLGYLWQTDRINDQKLFRITAMLHDVDLDAIAAAQAPKQDEIPPEELSLTEVTRLQQVLDRNYEVKMLSLDRGRQEYDHRLRLLKEQTARYDRLAQEWQQKLVQQEEQATQQNIATVVRDLEQVKPSIGRDLLMRWIDEGQLDDAILLMNKMSESKLAKILKTFQTPEELDKLHEIHERIISGGEEQSQLKKAIDELNGIEEVGTQSASILP